MNWTREKPTKRGLYWECSEANGNAPVLVHVGDEDPAGVQWTRLCSDVDDVEGLDSAYYIESWWMGPLEPPERP